MVINDLMDLIKKLLGDNYENIIIVDGDRTKEHGADESHNIALWCKGSTQEFDSCNTGSIPVRAVMGM